MIYVQLRDKDLPAGLAGNHPFRRLVGATVILSGCGHVVITVYRDAAAFHKDMKKTKYSRYAGQCWCLTCQQLQAA